MEKRIRRLGIFMVLCFVALFLQLNNIQMLKANSLANNPGQPAGAERVSAVRPGATSCPRTEQCWPLGTGSTGERLQVPAGLQPEHRQPLRPDRRVRLAHLWQLPADRGGVQQLPHVRTPHRGQDLARSAHQPHRGRQRHTDRQREPPDQVATAIDEVAAGGAPVRPPWCSTHDRGDRGDVLEPVVRSQPAGVPELEGQSLHLASRSTHQGEPAGGRHLLRSILRVRASRWSPPRPSYDHDPALGHRRLSVGVVGAVARHRHASSGADQLPQRRSARTAAETSTTC